MSSPRRNVSTCHSGSVSKSVINASTAWIICHHKLIVTVRTQQIVSPLRQEDNVEELPTAVRETAQGHQYNTYNTLHKNIHITLYMYVPCVCRQCGSVKLNVQKVISTPGTFFNLYLSSGRFSECTCFTFIQLQTF